MAEKQNRLPEGVEPVLRRRAGVWNGHWYDKAAQRSGRVGLRTRDYNEARAKLNALIDTGEIANLIAGDRRDAGLTVEAALDAYYKEYVTARDDKGRPLVADPVRQENAITHLKAWFGDRLLKEVSIPVCRSYAEARRAGVVGGGSRKQGDLRRGSDSTIRREINVLKAAANHARRWKRILLSDFPTFEAPKETEEAQEVGWLTKYEIATLIFEAKGPLRDFIILAYLWGARRASVETLERGQVLLDQGRVNLAKPGERKTKKRRPAVPIFPAMRGVLTARVAAAKGPRLFTAEELELYREAAPGARRTPKTVSAAGNAPDFYRSFRRLCRRLEMPHDHPHVLRHSRATHMLMDGESLYRVARLIGDTMKTVEKVYGHHDLEFLMGEAA
jgi:integrase